MPVESKKSEFINLWIKLFVLPCCNFKSDQEKFIKDEGSEGNRHDV
jgi:hypothetical protein